MMAAQPPGAALEEVLQVFEVFASGTLADEVYVLFNNNRWSRTSQGELAAQAPANARTLQGLLDVSGVGTH